MRIEGATALVTGANRGLGREFARQLLARGARVHGAARRAETVREAGVIPLRLDVTDPASVAAAVGAAPDVDLVVNNAGISLFTSLVDSDLDDIRREMDTNFYGSLAMVRAFAPALAARVRDGGDAGILNVLSALSWTSLAGASGYAASKAAAWSLTEGVRLELAGRGVQVTGLVMASTDTDMMAGIDVPKNDPADVVRLALDGLEAGAPEVLADEQSRQVKANLAREVSVTAQPAPVRRVEQRRQS